MITQSEAAKILGVDRNVLRNERIRPNPPDYIVNVGGKWMVDDQSESWQHRVARRSQGKTLSEVKISATKRAIASATKPSPETGSRPTLALQADEATQKILIYEARIKEEKAKQEEIRTLEKKRELAPVALVKYFFSFSENMLQRLYRRPHEIEPQLEALFMAHEGRKATQLMVRELEAIVVQCQQELMKAIEDEGYKLL
jgi:hypothetical protein